jgi:hypothetical protein
MVYRIGEDSRRLAKSACAALNMTGLECEDFAIRQIDQKLPGYLHFSRLCAPGKLYEVGRSMVCFGSSPLRAPRPIVPARLQVDPDQFGRSATSKGPKQRAIMHDDAPKAAAPSGFGVPTLELLRRERIADGSVSPAPPRPPLAFGDLAIAVLGSSSTLAARLPLLEEAWLRGCPIDVVVITDPLPASTNESIGSLPFVKQVACPDGALGIGCKTMHGLNILAEMFPGRKWYLRTGDAALVVPDNVLYHLSQLDPETPR